MNKIRPAPAPESERIDLPPLREISFDHAFELVPTPLLILGKDLVIVFANAAYLQTTGCVLSEIRGRHVFEAFPEAEERTIVFQTAFEEALRGNINTVTTEPFAIPVDGGGMREVIWTCTQIPLRDENGEIQFVMQNAVDQTEKHQSEQANRILVLELDHRVKNALATIQAVTRMSMVDTKTIQEARDDLLARMQAMSEVQNLLVERSGAGSHVRAVLSNALMPFGYDPSVSSRIKLGGPYVRLTPKQAQALSMAVHELATNAAKYGALVSEEGTVHVDWTFDRSANSHFGLTWREAKGPKVTAPNRKGFGTTMLTRILAQELNGEIYLDYQADGLVCTMEGRLEGRN